MRILVTGGAGFIGSNFILYWMNKYPKDQIINLDALTYAGNLENLIGVSDLENYEFIKGNITDADTVDTIVKRTDLIIHFAAESHVDRSIISPKAFIETNVLGTFTLLEAARKYKVRFHHVSTD